MTETIILTKQGLEEKKAELKHLIEVIRPQVIEELVEARNQGDLSENADYDAARNRQAELESKIKEIETMISNAEIIDSKSKSGEIKIGSTVEYLEGKKTVLKKIKIVGAVEANPFEGLISNESPIAKAILGQEVGVTVEIRDIAVPYKITVKSVK